MMIEERHFLIIRSILSRYPYTFYLFGSRAQGNPRALSDLDLCFIEPIPDAIIGHIREDFENSRLPYTVDLVSWSRCSSDFKEAIRKDFVLLQGTAQPT